MEEPVDAVVIAPPTKDETGDMKSTMVDNNQSPMGTSGGDEGDGPGQPGDETQQPVPAAAATEANAAPPEAKSEHHTPQTWTADKLAQGDPLLQVITPADWRLISVYGDTFHQNNGTHLLMVESVEWWIECGRGCIDA